MILCAGQWLLIRTSTYVNRMAGREGMQLAWNMHLDDHSLISSISLTTLFYWNWTRVERNPIVCRVGRASNLWTGRRLQRDRQCLFGEGQFISFSFESASDLRRLMLVLS